MRFRIYLSVDGFKEFTWLKQLHGETSSLTPKLSHVCVSRRLRNLAARPHAHSAGRGNLRTPINSTNTNQLNSMTDKRSVYAVHLWRLRVRLCRCALALVGQNLTFEDAHESRSYIYSKTRRILQTRICALFFPLSGRADRSANAFDLRPTPDGIS